MVLRTWEDYLSMAKKLHMDVYDEIVYRTRKLRRRHDDLVLKCQEKDIELQAEEMEEKFPMLMLSVRKSKRNMSTPMRITW